MHEKITLALGESVKLSAKDGIKADDNQLSKDKTGKWGTTGSAAVITSKDLESDSVEVTGSSIGKVLVFYRQPVQLGAIEALTAQSAGPDHMRAIEDDHAIAFEVEVVAKKDEKGNAVPVTPLTDNSQKFDGRLPMKESQEGPSEKTPYGMDQENKPVAPFPGMVLPHDDSSVARQSETAEAKKPGEPEPEPEKKKAAKKSKG